MTVRSNESGVFDPSPSLPTPWILIREAPTKRWLFFHRPHAIVTASQRSEVWPALLQIEATVKSGFHAAGFLAYEAAPAFDPALICHPPSDFPLLWFGLFDPPLSIAIRDPQPPVETLAWYPEWERDVYDRAFEKLKAYLRAGDTYQVNLSFRLRASFSENPWPLFVQMVRHGGAPYGAYLDTGRYVIVSGSPECFFMCQNDRVISRPMKGTLRRSPEPKEDSARRATLHGSEKDRAENLMIVDMIRNDLGKIARIGSVKVDSLFDIEKYPTVWQMTSTVSCQTEAPVSEIFKALFPCASVTGAPKPRTMAIIASLESSPRHVYTGSIGFMCPEGSAHFNVAIRTAIFDRKTGKAEYGVGGGVVWDSVGDREYRECLDKAAALTTAWPHFELLETLLWTPRDGFFLLEYHLRRLSRSAQYFDYSLDEEAIRRRLSECEAEFKCNGKSKRVRLLVGRSGGFRVESTMLDDNRFRPPIRLRFAPKPVSRDDPFLYHKTTHRSVYDAARAGCPACDDVVLWNEQGEITETTHFNLVVLEGAKRYTPPLSCGLLDGTYRRYLLEQGWIEEKIIRKEDITPHHRLFCINSVRRWIPAILFFDRA